MKNFSALVLVSVFASVFFSSNGFAGFKVCGVIQQNGSDLLFLQQLGADESTEGAIRGKTAEVQKELAELVGFRQVCVEATSDESDIIVSRILSRDE